MDIISATAECFCSFVKLRAAHCDPLTLVKLTHDQNTSSDQVGQVAIFV